VEASSAFLVLRKIAAEAVWAVFEIGEEVFEFIEDVLPLLIPIGMDLVEVQAALEVYDISTAQVSL